MSTIEIPDELAEQLRQAAEAAGLDTNIFAIAALKRGMAAEEEDDIDEDAVADLAQAIKEAETDPGLPLEEAFAEIRANFRERYGIPAAGTGARSSRIERDRTMPT